MARKPPPTDPATEAPDKGGRRSTYRPEYAKTAAKLCQLGATDRDLAEAFGIAERTVRYWRLTHEDFAKACVLGKAVADDRVEESLYRRAMGYSFDAVRILSVDGAPCSVPYVEHVPPDTTACIFWLKNRRPAEWRDRVDVMATVRPADTSSEPMSADEWDKRFGAGPRAN